MAIVKIIEEVSAEYGKSGWKLCFQACIYHYDTGESECGFRFIWR